MGRGFFGDLFDLDHNGELDSREQLLDFMAFEEMSKEDEGDEGDEGGGCQAFKRSEERKIHGTG